MPEACTGKAEVVRLSIMFIVLAGQHASMYTCDGLLIADPPKAEAPWHHRGRAAEAQMPYYSRCPRAI